MFREVCSVKRVTTFLILFVITFVGTYLILCYLPSLRIKLFAPPIEYFIESIKHMVFFKAAVSTSVGLLIAGVVYVLKVGHNFN